MVKYDATVHGDVDIIFAGGGTAACVTAGRLAKANPSLKILLIEMGPENFEDPTIRSPALFRSHMTPDSKTAIFYKSQPSTALKGREAIVASGRTLGGGSAINFMMYARAQGIDFDSWETPGWSAEEMIPLCNKLEKYCDDEPGIDKSKHGFDGPIHVSDGGFRAETTNSFMATVKSMGMKEIADLQDFCQIGGFSKWPRYVSKDGNRQDAAYCYIYPLIQRGQHPNLFILSQATVIRVVFEQSESGLPRATGVQYKLNCESCPETTQDSFVHPIVTGRRLVVIAAGALGTPQVLERSGVGNPLILKKAGIPVVVALPGVGENYQDHICIRCPYTSSLPPSETLDGIISGRQDYTKAVEEKNPILGWNGVDICSKLRMTDREVGAQSTEFQECWDRDFASSPSKPLLICGFANGFFGDQSLLSPGQYVAFTCFATYPYSRGSIHVEDPRSGYIFDAGFLRHKSDLSVMVWAYKQQREIARRLPFCTSEVGIGHPKFPTGSAARLTASDYLNPSPTNINYSANDDVVIQDWVRGNANTIWHSLGTCAMKPMEKGGVVDANLNVHGTLNLKIADLSIVPENVGANTNNTALVIGEKAALIIASELGIEL